MAQIKQDAKDQLPRIKKNVESAYNYFKENYTRFREFKKYVFRETINEQQRSMLQQLNRPVIEFNLGAGSVNRLLGEFADHEPGIEVSPAEGVPVGQDVLDVVEGSIRHTLYEANKHSFSNRIYKDMLGGGFAVAKVWTDYSSPMSFNQQIYWSHVFDSTMVGFDPLARDPHKGDGQFSFEIFPMLEDEFKRNYPNVEIKSVSYIRDIESFNWSYKDTSNQKIILVADYYEKKYKKVQIVRLADGKVMTVKRYKEMKQYWEEQQFIEQIPVVVGKPRWTTLEIIVNYKLIEDQILSYEETDYTFLPHVFFDGNSEILTQGTSNCTYQFCKPYYFHAKGAQDLMNFSGMAIANNIENMSMSKFIVKKEAIPQEQDYIEAITDPQRANTIVVNAYSENNPDKPIPEPIREVVNVPLPPDVGQTFNGAVGLVQAILGSMASNPVNGQSFISGKAIVESLSADNASAMPYVTGYLAGLGQMATIHVDLLPKYIVGKRTIPIVQKNGDKIYQDVNVEGKPSLNYEERAIKVNVEAGVNFQVQKNQALQQIIALMQASEGFSGFMNSEEGLKILTKNLTIYGADELQEAVPKFIEQQQQQQQQAMQAQQQAMQQDPRMIKAQADVQKVQLEAQEMQLKEAQQQFDNQIQIAKLANEKILVDSKVLEAEAKVSQAQIDSAVALEKAQTSLETHALDSATKLAEIHSREHDKAIKSHAAELAERKLEHEIKQSKREQDNE